MGSSTKPGTETSDRRFRASRRLRVWGALLGSLALAASPVTAQETAIRNLRELVEPASVAGDASWAFASELARQEFRAAARAALVEGAQGPTADARTVRAIRSIISEIDVHVVAAGSVPFESIDAPPGSWPATFNFVLWNRLKDAKLRQAYALRRIAANDPTQAPRLRDLAEKIVREAGYSDRLETLLRLEFASPAENAMPIYYATGTAKRELTGPERPPSRRNGNPAPGETRVQTSDVLFVRFLDGEKAYELRAFRPLPPFARGGRELVRFTKVMTSAQSQAAPDGQNPVLPRTVETRSFLTGEGRRTLPTDPMQGLLRDFVQESRLTLAAPGSEARERVEYGEGGKSWTRTQVDFAPPAKQTGFSAARSVYEEWLETYSPASHGLIVNVALADSLRNFSVVHVDAIRARIAWLACANAREPSECEPEAERYREADRRRDSAWARVVQYDALSSSPCALVSKGQGERATTAPGSSKFGGLPPTFEIPARSCNAASDPAGRNMVNCEHEGARFSCWFLQAAEGREAMRAVCANGLSCLAEASGDLRCEQMEGGGQCL